MASSDCRARIRPLVLLGLLTASTGCLTTPSLRTPPSLDRPAPPEQAFEAGVELPAGNGREILVAACLGCHELKALELFRDFYTRDSWHSLVETMRANGAQVDAADVDLLADYLTEHFGQNSP